MPEQNAAGRQGPAQAEKHGQSFVIKIVQAVVVYMLIQFLMKQFMGGKQPVVEVKDAEGSVVQVAKPTQVPPYSMRTQKLNEGAVYNQVPQMVAPIWPDDSKLDIIVTVSPSHKLTPLKDTPKNAVVLDEKGFMLGHYGEKRAFDAVIKIPEDVQKNGTLWGHFYVGLSGSSLDPTQPGFDPAKAYHFIFPMTQYVPRKKEAKTRSLLTGRNATGAKMAEDESKPPSTGPIIANYLHKNHSLSFIPGYGTFNYPQAHPAVRHFVQLEATGARDGSGQNSWYYPILFVNQFWQLKAHMTLLNETVRTMPLHIELNNLSHWKFMSMASIEASSREIARQAAFGSPLPGGGDGGEIEMIKEIFLDTNPILLGVTMVVSIFHLILETLAFGSDIAHYRKKKDNVGISLRSILTNAIMQLIVFLYLIDQSANTSWMILASQGVGIVIELWKITTVVDVRIRPAPPRSLLPYRISLEDKHKLSETEQKTKEYDEIAFQYMYCAAVPLLLAYAAYSLVYETHKSWYSYMITTLVGSVYAYGFLMMVPSLYINHRLKSVAHMPGKAMVYKFLNTFIDDLFAFTIKMPMLYRLATFRDDIIFFIYLYQRWQYKVDYTRINEFGQAGGNDKDKKDDDKALAPSVQVDEGAVKATGKSERQECGATERR